MSRKKYKDAFGIEVGQHHHGCPLKKVLLFFLEGVG